MKIRTDYLGKYSVSCPRTDQRTLCEAGNSPLVETNGGLGRVAGAGKEGNMWTGKHPILDHHVASLRKHLDREGKHQAQQYSRSSGADRTGGPAPVEVSCNSALFIIG